MGHLIEPLEYVGPIWNGEPVLNLREKGERYTRVEYLVVTGKAHADAMLGPTGMEPTEQAIPPGLYTPCILVGDQRSAPLCSDGPHHPHGMPRQ